MPLDSYDLQSLVQAIEGIQNEGQEIDLRDLEAGVSSIEQAIERNGDAVVEAIDRLTAQVEHLVEGLGILASKP